MGDEAIQEAALKENLKFKALHHDQKTVKYITLQNEISRQHYKDRLAATNATDAENADWGITKPKSESNRCHFIIPIAVVSGKIQARIAEPKIFQRSFIWIERVKENGSWSLMCPDKCQNLTKVYGEEFNKLYCEYEKKEGYVYHFKNVLRIGDSNPGLPGDIRGYCPLYYCGVINRYQE